MTIITHMDLKDLESIAERADYKSDADLLRRVVLYLKPALKRDKELRALKSLMDGVKL